MQLIYKTESYHMYHIIVDINELKINGCFLEKRKEIGYIWYNDWKVEGCIKADKWCPQVFQGADPVPEGYTSAVLDVLEGVIELISGRSLQNYNVSLSYNFEYPILKLLL